MGECILLYFKSGFDVSMESMSHIVRADLADHLDFHASIFRNVGRRCH